MKAIRRVIELLVAIAGLIVAINFRSPIFAGWRELSIGGIIAIVFLFVFLELRHFRKSRVAGGIVLIAIASLTIALSLQAKHLWIKHQVLNAPPDALARMGQHFIVGYSNLDSVKQLVEKRAIVGIYLSTRNIENKSAEQIKQEVETLQAIRRQQNLPPLWVSSDQEGGIVSRLSPPLVQQSAIAQLVTPTLQPAAILDYARTQAQGLASVGVNLNFAPVVDLNQGVINPNDKYSQIYRRAIASDPKVVAQVATWYCQALREFHVTCTMKHFPGLGRVTNDTHVEAADLATPIAELEKTDWVPFRQLMQTSRAFVMLSHAKLRAIDDQFATSFSEKVIRDLIRQQWNYQGILITDDFSMMAAYRAPGGVEQAVVRSLNSGTDLILVSYDHELYYELIHAAITSGSCNLSDCKLSSRSQEISRLLPRFAIASRVTHRNRPLSPSKQFNAESP